MGPPGSLGCCSLLKDYRGILASFLDSFLSLPTHYSLRGQCHLFKQIITPSSKTAQWLTMTLQWKSKLLPVINKAQHHLALSPMLWCPEFQPDSCSRLCMHTKHVLTSGPLRWPYPLPEQSSPFSSKVSSFLGACSEVTPHWSLPWQPI